MRQALTFVESSGCSDGTLIYTFIFSAPSEKASRIRRTQDQPSESGDDNHYEVGCQVLLAELDRMGSLPVRLIYGTFSHHQI